MSEEKEMREMNSGRGLTGKQRAFVNAYLGEARFNATEAAAMAGYGGSRNTLQSIGAENLAKPIIREEIERQFALQEVSAQEVLTLLADQMRATMDDFVSIPDGARGRFAFLDLEKAKQRGKLHLIKRMLWTQHGPRIELHDSQRAAELLGRALRLFVDRIEETHDGELVIRFARPGEGEGD